MTRKILSRQFAWLSLVLLLGILLPGCQTPSTEQTRMIPASSTAVFAMNLGQMGQKAISVEDLWHYLSRQEELRIQQQEIEASGIDFTGTVFGFFDSHGSLEMNTGVIFPLRDAEAFRTFLEDLSPRQRMSFRETAELQIAVIDGEQSVLVWDEQYALLMNFGGFYDSDPNQQVAAAQKLFLDGADTPITEEQSEFSDLLTEGADACFFVNYGEIAPMAMLFNQWAARTGVDELKLTGAVHFEDGKIETTLKAFYDDDASVYAGLIDDDFDEDLIDDLGSDSPIGLLTLALDMDAVLRQLEETGIGRELDQDLARSGLSLNQLLGSLTGDIALVANGLEMGRPSFLSPDNAPSEPELRYVVALGLKDHKSVQNTLNQLVRQGGLVEDYGNYTVRNRSIWFRLEEERLLIADPVTFVSVAEDDLADLPDYMTDLSGDYPYVMCMDPTNISDAFLSTILRDVPPHQREMAIDRFPVTRVEQYAAEPGNRKSVSTMVITTTDPNENALRTILQYLMELGEERRGGETVRG